jgi:oxygen-independent coproporphyrinogen-3 oxidase
MPEFKAVQWDSDLIERYNVSGPRYTSYPTALQFNESVDAAYYRKALDSIAADAPLSLYIHIPFCWHVCYYCACNKVVTRDYTRVAPYLEALEKEMKLVAGHLQGQPVKQMHWGGGTPTFLNSDDRKHLIELLRQHFNLAKDDEFECSIEVDPRTVTPEAIVELRGLGFNRLSLGIQDFNPRVQEAVNREQTFADTQALVEAARQQGFRSLSFDLIYGLPHQSVDTFNQTLEQVIQLRPDRLSVFNYAHLPHRFKPQRRINAEDLPSGEEKLAILQLTIEKMQQAGYVYIGMDHFALPDDELARAQRRGELHRNFQGYTTHKACDLIGLGVSSIGSINGNYIQNQRNLTEYYEALEQGQLPVWRGAKISRDDAIRKAVIFQLICNFELSIPAMEAQLGIRFWEYFADARSRLELMQADGLIELSEEQLMVTDRGRLFVRNICMVFDGYLFGEFAQKGLIAYSKAI